MIYNDRLIFAHNPKTGGMSVSHALGGKAPGLATHTPLRCVEKGNRFAFGFVRNPWARMVSLYRFLCQKPFRKTDNFDQQHVREIGFKRWLTDDQFWMQEDLQPTGEPWVMRTHWRGDGGSELPPMQRRPQMWWLEGADFIGRAETLRDDFAEVCRLIGIQAQPVQHINRTAGGDWQAEYDDDTRDFVAEHFAPDIARFGYRCG